MDPDPGDVHSGGGGVSSLFDAVLDSMARPKPLSSVELATDAAIARGTRQGLAYVEALEDEEGYRHVIRLLHEGHDWAGDARAEKYHLRSGVSDLDAETYYEAFDRAATTRAREVEGHIESLAEAAAERMGEG